MQHRRTAFALFSYLIFLLIFSAPFAAAAVPAGEAPPADGSGSQRFSDHEQSVAALAEIDAQLGRGEWADARARAEHLIEQELGQPRARFLPSAVARLALAQAGLGERERAIWTWHVAQNLGIRPPREELLAYGAAGELLAAHPLRRAGEMPPGVAVREAGAGGDALIPPRPAAGVKATFSVGKLDSRVPRWLKVQLVVDAQGRPSHPVVMGASLPGLVYAVLAAVGEWRFEPARAGGAPVAAFHEMGVDAPRSVPVETLLPFEGKVERARRLLAEGKTDAARELAREAVHGQIDAPGPDAARRIAAGLLVESLANAALGREAEATCRWRIAQQVVPALIHAELSPFGAAGELLEREVWRLEPRERGLQLDGPLEPAQFSARWDVRGRPLPSQGRRMDRGFRTLTDATDPVKQPVAFRLWTSTDMTPVGGGAAGIEPPRPLEHPQPFFPSAARLRVRLAAPVVIEAIIDQRGSVKEPLVLGTADALLSLVSLDTVCGWRFDPARLRGEPVTVFYTLTVDFKTE